MEIDRDSAVPLWHQIALILERELTTQQVRPDTPFATAVALSQRFGVNRHTIRQALGSLVDKGLIRIAKGYGSFVEPHVIDYTIGKRTRFTANLLRNQVEPGHEVLATWCATADTRVAEALDLLPETPVHVLQTLGKADGQPISTSTTYVSRQRFPDFPEAYRRQLSFTRALAHSGIHDYTRHSTRVLTRLPTPEDARLLAQPRTQPIFIVESVDIDEQARPIVFKETRFAGERVQLIFEP